MLLNNLADRTFFTSSFKKTYDEWNENARHKNKWN